MEGEEIDNVLRIYNYTTEEKSAAKSRKLITFND